MFFDQKDICHARLYYKRLNEGLCPKCGKERDADGLWCTACLTRSKDAKSKLPMKVRSRHNSEFRKRCRKKGLCSCGNRRDDKRFKKCSTCRAKRWAYRHQDMED